jgi:REP element-mobilizing transposase RayT
MMVRVMPRAYRYLLPGYPCHLTHRCHDGQWLMRFSEVREEYRRRLKASLKGSGVSLLSYCVTSDHVHLNTISDDPEATPRFMQRQQGGFAEWYNRRKKRKGAFWTDRYHATMIESGEHLWRCMRYCDLNMVRAGAVEHPREWRWCGYDELVGERQRYRLLDMSRVVELTGSKDAEEFARNYRAFVEEAISGERLARESRWTESIAVGSRAFVEEVAGRIEGRVNLAIDESGEETWTVREVEPRYGRQA